MFKYKKIWILCLALVWISMLSFSAKTKAQVTGNLPGTESTEEDDVTKEEKFKLPFCHSTTMGSSDLEEYITLHSSENSGDIVQGICAAEEYIIATRWYSNNATTEFKVYNSNGTVQRTYRVRAGHANSLTYNPKKHELLVAACDDSGRLFLFSFMNGALTYRSSITLPYNITKVCYVSSVDKYYMSTGVRVFSTSDFRNINYEFNIDDFAMGQGMASDGNHLYICWTPTGKNVIRSFSLTGQFLKEYTISGNVCHELEEIDFMNGDMLIADNRAVADKIYKVTPTHNWSAWKEEAKASCIQEGLMSRECSSCGSREEKVLPVNKNHKPGEPVESPSSCVTSGVRQTYCTLCHQLISEEEIPALGHDYTEWEYIELPTIFHGGERTRSCKRCHITETEQVKKLKAICQPDKHYVKIPSGSNETTQITLSEEDQIKEISSDNPLIATMDQDGLIHGWIEGYAKICITTEAGARAEIQVRVEPFNP